MKALTAKRLKRFKNWLTYQGVELLPELNDLEVLRFHCALGLGIVYANKSRSKFSINGSVVDSALNAWSTGQCWVGKGKSTGRFKLSARKKMLLNRDGDDCFYCGWELLKDITVEHLVSVCQQGPDRLENMVLTHRLCNLKAGNLPVVKKIMLREQMHKEQQQFEESGNLSAGVTASLAVSMPLSARMGWAGWGSHQDGRDCRFYRK